MLTLIVISTATVSQGMTPVEFQNTVNQLNGYLRAGGSADALSIMIDLNLPEDQRLLIRLGGDLQTLQIHLHPVHLQNPDVMVALLSELSGVLEFPLQQALRGVDRPTSELLNLLLNLKVISGLDFFFFNLLLE